MEFADLSLQDAAAAVGVTAGTLLKWVKEGKIRAYRLGRAWRFKRKDLEAAFDPVKAADLRAAPDSTREAT